MSLRDVERTLKVFGWFYNQTAIIDEMDNIFEDFYESESDLSEDEDFNVQRENMVKVVILISVK